MMKFLKQNTKPFVIGTVVGIFFMSWILETQFFPREAIKDNTIIVHNSKRYEIKEL